MNAEERREAILQVLLDQKNREHFDSILKKLEGDWSDRRTLQAWRGRASVLAEQIELSNESEMLLEWAAYLTGVIPSIGLGQDDLGSPEWLRCSLQSRRRLLAAIALSMAPPEPPRGPGLWAVPVVWIQRATPDLPHAILNIEGVEVHDQDLERLVVAMVRAQMGIPHERSLSSETKE